MTARKRQKGFFSDWRRVAILVAAGAVLLGGGLILILKLTESKAPEEPRPNPVATITMSDGSQMRFELYPDLAPNTVANFIDLANSGYYDRSKDYGKQQFYRVVAGVFIEGGDPLNTGTGGPNYAIKGEFSENGFKGNTVSHMRGAISMARQSGYDTAGSQFFIMEGSYPEYDGFYAAFGMAADEETLAVIDAIASQPTDSQYIPLTRQEIQSIRVETFEVEYPEPETIERD